MLSLTRGIGKSVYIGDDIEIKVVNIYRSSYGTMHVMLGIEAPKSLRIHRSKNRLRGDKDTHTTYQFEMFKERERDRNRNPSK